ncbi:putative Tartrateresistant acid phosphatase type 5 [Trypanosoma cruzi]|nr:putative Tartrateresistant acid phosphatase type 5 [Trypanosoma cruzi]
MLSSSKLFFSQFCVWCWESGGEFSLWCYWGDRGLGAHANCYGPEIVSTRLWTDACGKFGCNFTISVGDNFYCSKAAFCIWHSFEYAIKDVSVTSFPFAENHEMMKAQIEYSKRYPRWYWPSCYYTA